MGRMVRESARAIAPAPATDRSRLIGARRVLTMRRSGDAVIDRQPGVASAGAHAKWYGAAADLHVIPHAGARLGDEPVVAPRDQIGRRRKPDGRRAEP